MSGFKKFDVVYSGNDKCVFYSYLQNKPTKCLVMYGYNIYEDTLSNLKSEKEYLESIKGVKKEESKVDDLVLEVGKAYNVGGSVVTVKALYDEHTTYEKDGVYYLCHQDTLVMIIKTSMRVINTREQLKTLESVYSEVVEALKSGEWRLKDGVGVLSLVEKV